MAYTTIDNPELFFNTVTYTGNATARTITGVGFQPDLVWGKIRSEAQDHVVVDAIRGATKQIYPSDTSAEQTESQGLTGFASDGFTLGTHAYFNKNTATYVAYNWKGNGAGSSNTAGDINSTVSANTTSGFSIVQYTGNGSTNQTVGHGLGMVPSFIIVKQTNTTRNWPTYTQALGNGVAFLDINDAWAGGSSYQNYWYTSGMTTTTFGISNNDNTNASSGTFIAYVFANVKGYCKVGSYTGNGNADGVFVYTGFKPAFVIFKRTNAAENWGLMDNRLRPANNVGNNYIYPDLTNAQDSTSDFDMLSNGFKIRTASNFMNGGGATYLYIAIAENPFVTSGTKAAGTAR